MSRVRITRIKARGLKARDFSIRLSDVSVLVGENGRSKSAVIDALYLLALGFAPGVDRTSDGVMSLARDRAIEIDADVEIDGESHVVTREWKRDRGGKVAETIKGTLRELGEKSTPQKRAHLAGLFGAYAEAWAPSEILDLSPAKLRARLLSRIPQEGDLSVGAIVPGDCPSWALPSQTTVTAIEWAAYAVKKARGEVEHIQSSIREMQRKLDEDLGDAWDDLEPIETTQQDLASYRHDLLDLRTRELAASRLARAEQDVARARVAAGSDGDPVPSEIVRLVAAIMECAAAESRFALSGLRKTAEATRTERDKIAAALKPFASAKPATIEDLTRIEDDLAGAQGEVDRTIKKLAELRGARAVLDRPHLTKCPDCGSDLVAHAARVAGELDREIADVEAEGEMFVAFSRDLRTERDTVRRGVERGDLDAMLAEREMQMHTAAREFEIAQALYLTPEQSNAADQAAMRCISAAVDRARGARDLASAEERLAVALAERDQYPASARTVSDLEALIKTAEEEIARRGAANSRRLEYRREKDGLDGFRQLEEDRKVWIAKFTEIQTDLVDRAKGWLEERLTNGLGGAKVTIELLDARGNDDCRIAVDGVDATSLSDGERATFLAALVITLAEVSDAPWKPLILDRFEHVSKRFREPFLRAVIDAARAGRVSQAIVAGCPDSVPTLEGVEVTDMDALDATGTNRKLAVAAVGKAVSA